MVLKLDGTWIMYQCRSLDNPGFKDLHPPEYLYFEPKSEVEMSEIKSRPVFLSLLTAHVFLACTHTSRIVIFV